MKALQDTRENDKVSTTTEIKQKLSSHSIPTGITNFYDTSGNLVFLSVQTSPYPKIRYSLVVKSDLSYQLVYADALVSLPNHFKISNERIQYAAEVASLLCHLDGFSDRDQNVNQKYVETACVTLKFVTEREKDKIKVSKLAFLLEQLELLYKCPTGRRYSIVTLAMCMTWYKTSLALYDLVISDIVLTIPSSDHVKRLSSALNDDMSFSDSMIAYLKAKMSVLSERDKNVLVILDEVKTNQGIQYVGGNFFGKTEEGVTKGLLSIMVSSLAGKYRDNVAMVPVVNLNSTKMDEVYQKVLKGITNVGFSTGANSVDGHRTNKKFYKDLCGGKITESFENPYNPSETIFNLLDTTHFKCIYNIFLTRNGNDDFSFGIRFHKIILFDFFFLATLML